ncbi:hypothetical protein DC498_17640 [Terrimonas sp.]|uniref:hypothetical protein n=1 Tax=Terrimonas sp. TaxID=1914338 RepID=UPI000D50E4D1|nr:hypothetical protein [Terrimonas sp.]PVD50795.1 hypothetical protein DC498_17640 [Terrimonas sp.]
MENRWYAEQAVKAALAGDKEKASYFIDRMNESDPEQTLMFLHGKYPPDTVNYRGKEMTWEEFEEMKKLDERMGVKWIHTTLDIK